MGKLRLQKKVVRWGHGYGIRISKAELARAGLRENEFARVEVEPTPGPVDLNHLTLLRLGQDASERHDESIAEGILGGH